MEGDWLFEELQGAPGVLGVSWNSSKTSQNNRGNHWMERNILVYVKGFPKTPIEFELSRNEHMKEMPGRAFTVTALFKEPPRRLHEDAWRILMYVVSGKELMPVLAQK